MKKLFIAIITLFAVSACNDDFMERYPLDKINDSNYWQSNSDVEMYANQFYPHIGGWSLDINSDDLVYNRRNSYIWNIYALPQTGGGWSKSDWQQISRCNVGLARVADMEKDDITRQFEGELLFFRAYFYHEKIKRFGDVPWFEKDLQTDSEELFKARDSRKVVFANIFGNKGLRS